ncbi:hypothetical protein K1T71_006744 [Dendrolimus kikuchii]|uniref:Uncharacterized protein n=1 Tax=Dendrolimus kikuchii TaxID=765133 RepID=A0ACC1D1P8_9NEOP|nr:hypothetical protein K1T71_006744 [Dendrolimus kikuchii]
MYEKLNINGEVKLFLTGRKQLKDEAFPTIEHQFIPIVAHKQLSMVYVLQEQTSYHNQFTKYNLEVQHNNGEQQERSPTEDDMTKGKIVEKRGTDTIKPQSYDHFILEEEMRTPSTEFSWQQPETAVEISEDEGEDEAKNLEVNSSCSDDNERQIDYENIKEHAVFRCNSCTESIVGARYVCVQCTDWDLCGACEAIGVHNYHYVLRIAQLRPLGEVRSVLARIRQHLVVAMDPSLNADGTGSVETKIKEKYQEVPLQKNKAESNCEKVGHLRLKPVKSKTKQEVEKMLHQKANARDAQYDYKKVDLQRTDSKKHNKNVRGTEDERMLLKIEQDKIKTYDQKPRSSNIVRITRKKHITPKDNNATRGIAKRIVDITPVKIPVNKAAPVRNKINFEKLNEKRMKMAEEMKKTRIIINKGDYEKFVKS